MLFQSDELSKIAHENVFLNLVDTKTLNTLNNINFISDETIIIHICFFYMLAKYVPGNIKCIFTKFYRHISTNNEANRKFVILISNLFMGCGIISKNDGRMLKTKIDNSVETL